MTGLVLKLKPHEKLLINGVVLQNGDKAAKLRVRTAGASVLRQRDALHPNEAITPVQKAYYVAQLAIAGAADEAAAKVEIIENLTLARNRAAQDHPDDEINAAEALVIEGKLFAAMRVLRKIAFVARSGGTPDPEGVDRCFSPQSQ